MRRSVTAGAAALLLLAASYAATLAAVAATDRALGAMACRRTAAADGVDAAHCHYR